jgi:electron transfer flavoprotein beta subunit
MRGIMTARSKPLKVVDPIAFTSVSAKVTNYDNPPEKGSVKLIDAENAEQLIDLLANEAKVL